MQWDFCVNEHRIALLICDKEQNHSRSRTIPMVFIFAYMVFIFAYTTLLPHIPEISTCFQNISCDTAIVHRIRNHKTKPAKIFLVIIFPWIIKNIPKFSLNILWVPLNKKFYRALSAQRLEIYYLSTHTYIHPAKRILLDIRMHIFLPLMGFIPIHLPPTHIHAHVPGGCLFKTAVAVMKMVNPSMK